MNSETVRPTPPRRFKSARNGTSVTPAIGESTSGGLISTSLILKGLLIPRRSLLRLLRVLLADRADQLVAPRVLPVRVPDRARRQTVLLLERAHGHVLAILPCGL